MKRKGTVDFLASHWVEIVLGFLVIIIVAVAIGWILTRFSII